MSENSKVATMPGVGKDKAKAKTSTTSNLPALPKLPKSKKARPAKECGCGCGDMTKGGSYIPGHDAKLHGWALRVERGVITLNDIPHDGIRAKVKDLLQTRQTKAAAPIKLATRGGK